MHLEYAISDVHGHLQHLERLLQVIEQHAREREATFTLLFLGDLVDRGNSSAQVVELVRFLQASKPDTVVLKGNHDDVFAEAVPFMKAGQWDSESVRFALSLGVQKTLDSYVAAGLDSNRLESDVAWINSLPLLRVSKGRAFVHAGLMPHYEPHLQPAEAMLWIRDRFFHAKKRDFPGVNYVVHGHTPTKYMKKSPASEIEVFDWRCNIDTGVFFTGALGCAVFDVDKPGPPIDQLYVHGEPEGEKFKKSKGGVFIPS